jgi:hypothetical protein
VQEQKHSKLSSLNPFHRDKSPAKEKQEVSPQLQEAIEQMKNRKAQKLEEMEKEGKKPNDGTTSAYAFGLGGGGLGSLG